MGKFYNQGIFTGMEMFSLDYSLPNIYPSDIYLKIIPICVNSICVNGTFKYRYLYTLPILYFFPVSLFSIQMFAFRRSNFWRLLLLSCIFLFLLGYKQRGCICFMLQWLKLSCLFMVTFSEALQWLLVCNSFFLSFKMHVEFCLSIYLFPYLPNAFHNF